MGMHIKYEDSCDIYDNIVQGVSGLKQLFDEYNVSEIDREAIRELLNSCWNLPAI